MAKRFVRRRRSAASCEASSSLVGCAGHCVSVSIFSYVSCLLFFRHEVRSALGCSWTYAGAETAELASTTCSESGKLSDD